MSWCFRTWNNHNKTGIGISIGICLGLCIGTALDLSSKKELLQKDLCVKVLDNGNLFLVTNPLMPGEKESEIELLFDDSTRNHIINGKNFSLDNKYDKKIFYGKDIFSNYILSNYQQINFDNFKPMLSNFVSVINNYSNEH